MAGRGVTAQSPTKTRPGQLVPLQPRVMPPQSPEKGLRVSSTLRGAELMPRPPETDQPHTRPSPEEADKLAQSQFSKCNPSSECANPS